MSKNTHSTKAEPLETRHVFLDTESYKGLGHNPANPALRTLGRHIADRKVVLHLTDLTLREVKRQLHEEVESRDRDLRKIEKSLRRWRHVVPTIPQSLTLDTPTIGSALYTDFDNQIRHGLGAQVHEALNLPAAAIFDSYFARQAPFDREGSKEFPDAFVLEALKRWCEIASASLYVVTLDKAMLRAVEQTQGLLPLPSIQEVLQRASLDPDHDADQLADGLLNDPAFDYRLEEAVESAAGELVFEYDGDLPEAEVVDVQLGGVEAVEGWRVVWQGTDRICLFIDVRINALVTVQFEDRTLAMYDREDGRWYGSDSSSTEREITPVVELFVEMAIPSGAFIFSELQKTDYVFRDAPDWD